MDPKVLHYPDDYILVDESKAAAEQRKQILVNDL